MGQFIAGSDAGARGRLRYPHAGSTDDMHNLSLFCQTIPAKGVMP